MALTFPITLSSTIQFSAIRREERVPIPIELSSLVKDIKLMFFLQPGSDHLHPFSGPENIRLYINEYDVTLFAKKALKNSLSKLPHEQIKQSYLFAAQSYLRTAKSLNFIDDISSEKRLLENYAKSTNWADKIDRKGEPEFGFGDRQVGWSGNLHVCHYIYRSITCESISIAEIFKDFASSKPGTPSTIQELSNIVITFSQGQSPYYGNFDPKHIPTGQLYYHLEPCYTHEVINNIREALVKIQANTSSAGHLSRNILNAQAYLDKLKLEISNLDNLVRAESQQIQQLQSLAESIERKLNAM